MRIHLIIAFLSLWLFTGVARAEDACEGRYLGHNGSFYKDKSEGCPQCKDQRQSTEAVKAEAERKLAKAFAVPGMCCTDFTVAEGMTCRGKMEPYPEDVIVYIPASFKPSEKTDVILHLHGHYASGLDFETTVPRRFKFPELLASTGRNSILVIPKSDDKCSTYDKEFIPDNSKKGFQDFMDALDAKLTHLSVSGKPSIGAFALSGHSGAYRSIDGILQQKKNPWFSKIQKVVMFEATYGPNDENPRRPGLIDFVQHQGGKFTSVFINEYDTRLGSEYLEKQWCLGRYGEDIKPDDLEKCMKSLEGKPKAGRPRFIRFKEWQMQGNRFNHEHYQALIKNFGKLLAP